MNTSYKAVLRVKYATDTTGIINIRKTLGRRSTYTSLKIKCPVRYWNERSGTVRKNDVIDYVSVNEEIADKIREFEKYAEQPDYKPLPSKKSYVYYFEGYIIRYANPGSRIKYETVLNKIRKYLASVQKQDLLFHEIDSKLLYEFRYYTLKKASLNTANHYLKIIKQVLNNAIKESYYSYIKHPFLTIEFKNNKVKKSALTEAEIKKLIKAPIPESSYLFNTRNKFLTQIFLQGLRVSDLQMLRYSMIQGNSLVYSMVKTSTPMVVYISDIVWKIFIYQYKEYLRQHSIETTAIPMLEQELQVLNEKVKEEYGITTGIDLVIEAQLKNGLIEPEPVFKEIKTLQNQIFESYKMQIREFGRLNRGVFIFDFLQDVNINNIDEERLYKVIKNKTIVYNRHLKELQKAAKIETVFKSHLSRSSYASLLLNSGVDVYNISAALGHSGLNITEKYLSGFDNNKTVDINKKLSETFS